MAYQIYCTIALLVLPFSLLALSKGQYLLAALPTCTAVLGITNVYSFRTQRVFWINPILTSLFYIADVMLVIWQLGAVGAFWAFPTILALYWVHERKTASQLVTLFFAGVLAVGFFRLSLEETARIFVTLLATALFINMAAAILERQYEELKTLTITDHLTGAFNRRYMDWEIGKLLARFNRQAAPASMIILDVDHFKQVNDQFGHSTGDKVLIELVQLIQSRLRLSDQVCRSGGEEFVILLPDTAEAEARRVGEELRASISESPILHNAPITVSCGVSALRPGDDRDSWFRRCDEALYRAKQAGRDRVVLDSVMPELELVGA